MRRFQAERAGSITPGLAFARDGSMILGFRDRFMDLLSAKGLDPRPGNNTPELGMSGGDINMACVNPAGGYSWEGTGSCPNHATPANDGGKTELKRHIQVR